MDLSTVPQVEIHIDPEFSALMPPLADEERAQLEANLVKEGSARDPLVVWWRPRCPDILVDGHNRYEICSRLGLPYQIMRRDFADRAEVITWMIENQRGRRNLPPMVRAELALKLEAAIAEQAKERQRGGQGGVLLPAMLPEANSDTRDQIAKVAGVGARTISKVKAIKAAEAEGRVDADTMAALRQGKTTINAVHLQQLEAARRGLAEQIARSAKLDNDLAEGIKNLSGASLEDYEQRKAESLWFDIKCSFDLLCKRIKKTPKFRMPAGEPGAMRLEEKRVELPPVPKKYEKDMREMAAVITRFINEQGL